MSIPPSHTTQITYVRVILSSGFSRDNDLEEMRREGVCAFIEKPYQIDTLTKALDAVMDYGAAWRP